MDGKEGTKRSHAIRKVSLVAVAGNALLAILKIIIGVFANSLAVVGDGIDSLTDILSSVLMWFTAGIIDRPPDREHPYGHARAETLATKIIAFVIFFAGAQLFISALQRLVSSEATALPSLWAVYVTLLSIFGKGLLAIFQLRKGKKLSSSMITANGKNMVGDIAISSSVFVGLLLAYYFSQPLIDTIFALLISLWIVWLAFSIFMDTNNELMEGVDDKAIYQKVFDAVKSVPGAHNAHRVRVRKMANVYVADLDIEVRGDLPVKEAHKIAHQVEWAIFQNIDSMYDVIIHIEPLGDKNENEKFGLSEDNY
jgi:cation diffusion facilitator family transporter